MMRGRSPSSPAIHHQSTSSIYFTDHHQNHENDVNSLRSEQLAANKSPRSTRIPIRTVNHFLFPAFLLECAILAGLAVFAYYLRFTSVFKGHQRIIPCIDYSLGYPHYMDNMVTNSSVVVYVNQTTLYCVSVFFPVGLVVLWEVFYWLLSPPDRKLVSTITESLTVPLAVRRITRFVGTYWIGLAIISILTDSMKLLSGRPRPYFLTVCNAACNSDLFITVDDCQHANAHLYRDALLSFPSYFSTLSSFAAVFAICYTQAMTNIHGNYFLRPLLFGIFSGMSLLAGFTRWTLYVNHWEDLLVGYLIGSGFAIYLSVGILNSFRENLNRRGTNRIIENLSQEEETHPWFGWFALPRISTQRSSGGIKCGVGGPKFPASVYMNGNNSETNSSSIGPNPAFQQEIHRRVEDFGRKNQH